MALDFTLIYATKSPTQNSSVSVITVGGTLLPIMSPGVSVFVGDFLPPETLNIQLTHGGTRAKKKKKKNPLLKYILFPES